MAKRVIEFGKWEGRPIRWLVLGKNADGKYLCLAEDGLFEDSFTGVKHIKPEDCISNIGDTWDKCGLRNWLNAMFIDEAFTPEEASRLNTVLVPGNEDTISYGALRGKCHADTRDKVFLLSETEALWFLTRDERRQRDKWWLRTTVDFGGTRAGMRCIPASGDFVIHEFGSYADKKLVRPAIVIDM